LAPVAKPLSPPSVGSARILPSSHTTPRHVAAARVGNAKKLRQLHVSPRGCGVVVCAMPAIRPLVFFTGHATLLFGPPSVPRSKRNPYSHSIAWRLLLSARFAKPAMRLWSLMLLPAFSPPPSAARLTTRNSGR
jgi:hypothetical protein